MNKYKIMYFDTSELQHEDGCVKIMITYVNAYSLIGARRKFINRVVKECMIVDDHINIELVE